MSQQRIVWVAIAISTVIYAFISYTLNPIAQQPFDTSARDPLTIGLYIAALAAFVAAMVIPRLIAAPQRVKMIVALALFESCAIFALVASMLHRDWRLYLPGWALAVIGFLREWPSAEVSAPAA